MAQTFFKIIIDGYHTGETDFATALDRKSREEQAAVFSLIDGLVQAEAHPEAGVFQAVCIIGESDRVDDPGLSGEARRARELQGSADRARSAGAWLLAQFQAGVTSAGGTAPTSFVDPLNVGVTAVFNGAADLVHPTPANEAQRRQNRRVQYSVMTFEPGLDQSDWARPVEPSGLRI